MSLTVRGFNCVTFFRLDPSSALDFLWACSHIPRIWQGRDQKISQVRSKAHVQSPESKSPFFSAFFVKAQPDRVHSAEADDSCTFFFFCLCRRKQRSLCYDSLRRSSSAWSTWSCRSLSSTVATHPTMTKAAAWTRSPAPSSSPGCPSFTPTAMEIWKTSRKSRSTSSTAQRNGRTGKVYISCHPEYLLFQHLSSTLSRPSICKHTYAHHILLNKAQPIHFHTLHCSS